MHFACGRIGRDQTNEPAMKIFLVRHGQASAKWHESDDPGLSEMGQRQAAAAAQQLAALVGPGVRLISSPMLRARETARPLSEALDADVSIVDAFREIPTPVPLAERQTWLKRVAGQQWNEQHAMVREWHRSLLQRLSEISQPSVVFTHFMVLNAIVGALSDAEKVICFLPDNASITKLQLHQGSLELLELGHQLKTIVH